MSLVPSNPPGFAPDRPRLFADVSPARLALGLVVAGVAALSIHAVMLDLLGVPYPGAKIVAPFWQFMSRGALHVLGLIWLDAAIGHRLSTRSVAVRGGVLFLIATTLTEALLRGPFMDGYCGAGYAVAFAGAVPKWAAEAAVAFAVAAARPWLPTWPRRVAAALAIGAVSVFALSPLAAQAASALQDALAALAGTEWCTLPYGWNVNLPAYLSFAEPVLAAAAMAALAWDGLSQCLGRRLLQFILLVVMIRRQLLAAFIYMAWSGLPAGIGLAAMGQFSLEAIALGALTGLAWHVARRR